MLVLSPPIVCSAKLGSLGFKSCYSPRHAASRPPRSAPRTPQERLPFPSYRCADAILASLDGPADRATPSPLLASWRTRVRHRPLSQPPLPPPEPRARLAKPVPPAPTARQTTPKTGTRTSTHAAPRSPKPVPALAAPPPLPSLVAGRWWCAGGSSPSYPGTGSHRRCMRASSHAQIEASSKARRESRCPSWSRQARTASEPRRCLARGCAGSARRRRYRPAAVRLGRGGGGRGAGPKQRLTSLACATVDPSAQLPPNPEGRPQLRIHRHLFAGPRITASPCGAPLGGEGAKAPELDPLATCQGGPEI
jgi:hypothetical protein